jgi:hypothetical protein
MISGAFHSGVQTRFAQTGGPRAEWKSPSIMLMNLIKRLKSMAMIYILPVTVNPLVILRRPSGRFELLISKLLTARKDLFLKNNDLDMILCHSCAINSIPAFEGLTVRSFVI